MKDFTCSECRGMGGVYLDTSFKDMIPCKECNGTGERQFKVVKVKDTYRVVYSFVRTFLKRVYFKGNFSECNKYANELNKEI